MLSEQKYHESVGSFANEGSASRDLVSSRYVAAHALNDSKKMSQHKFMNQPKTASHLRKRSLTPQENIPYEIFALITDQHFDTQLRNALDSIFRLAVSSPEIVSTPKDNLNLFILFKCIQHMHLFIKKNSPLVNEQKMMDALFKIADCLDRPRDRTSVKIFKEKFFSKKNALFNTNVMSNSSMYNITQGKNFGEDNKVFSSNEEAEVVFAEQTRHISKLLEKNQFKTYKVQSFNRINNLIEYLSLESDQGRLDIVAKLLLKPTGLYGSSKGESISEERKMAVIADYLNHALLGMTLEKWIIKQAQVMTLSDGVWFTNVYLGYRLNNVICGFSYKEKLSAKAQAYYKNNVLKKLLPTLSLQLPASEQRELAELIITKPQWGFIHAGAMFLNSRKVGLDGMSLADIEDSGMMLYILINQGGASPEYAEYFRLPTLLHHEVYKYKHKKSLMADEQNMPEIYLNYFNYLNKLMRDNDPIEQFALLARQWKTRTALAQKQLHFSKIDAAYLNSYLNYHADNFAGVTLPNIDRVFEEQNHKLANMAYEVDRLMLPQVFNSLDEEDQKFIQQSKADRVRIQFNALDSIKKVPLPPAAMMGLIQSGGLTFHIPDHIDLLACTLKGKERIYALEISSDKKYTLSWVDRDRERLLWLLDNSSVSRADLDYQIKVNSHLTLKEAAESSQKLIEKLAEFHKNKLFKVLTDQGYDKTTQEKINEFLLSLIPLYTCITESRRGNEQEAISACIMDAFSLVPFAGKAVQVGMRFSTALAGATAMALKHGAQQTMIKGIMKQTSKELMHYAPFVAQEISPKVMQGLAVKFLRDVDPGFGLLTSGVTQGVRVMENILSKIPNKSRGVYKLSEALQRENEQLLAVPKKTNLRIESIFCPAQGKNLDVTLVGNKDGQQIWAQINRETNEIFGQKFIRTTKGYLEQVNVALGQRNQKPARVKNENKNKDGKVKASGSEVNEGIITMIGPNFLGPKTVAKHKIGGTNYIQYYTKIPGKEKGSEVLVLTAHGGYTRINYAEDNIELSNDYFAPPIILPPDLTIKILTPHDTALVDPGLNNVVNAGAHLKTYLTIKNGDIQNIDFLPQQGHSGWKFPKHYNPESIFSIYGKRHGLQNYRHFRYEQDDSKRIAKILIKNRKLAEKGEAILTDVLAVDKQMSDVMDTSLEKASIKRVLDLDREGKLLNEKGRRYKSIVFVHCRADLFQEDKYMSIYYMEPKQLKAKLDKGAQNSKSRPNNPVVGDITLTRLYRKEIGKEFTIVHQNVGRFIFTRIQQFDIESTPISVVNSKPLVVSSDTADLKNISSLEVQM